MQPISIMINGMPGNVASIIARHAMRDKRFTVIRHSLTGPDITAATHSVDGEIFHLVSPTVRDEEMRDLMKKYPGFIAVDYTHPTAVNENAAFYCRKGIPFVMGTTGGDRDAMVETVKASTNSAVIAPNMAKQIVGFQAMMAYAAETFPDLFKGYDLDIRESHQKGKADTSGTAKAMVGYFNKMGIPFSSEQIIQERDPETQKNQWGIPEAYLGGHAWHTYTLTSRDRTVAFQFTHNINGRDIYAEGTLDAVVFLMGKIREGAAGSVFSMMDVLKAGANQAR